jgi:hypothetical protein
MQEVSRKWGFLFFWFPSYSSYTISALTRWEWEVYFLTSLVYEKSILILVYPMRIQSDHSESDRSYSQETLASVPITEKDPLERVFFFGRFISLLSIFRLSTTEIVYLCLLENQIFHIIFFIFSWISLVFVHVRDHPDDRSRCLSHRILRGYRHKLPLLMQSRYR